MSRPTDRTSHPVPRRAPGPASDLTSGLTRLRRDFPLVDGHPDVAGVLRQPHLLARLGPLLAHPYRDAGVDLVLAPEARGPILGALVATELGAGLVLARKAGRNHPGADLRVVSEPGWRGEEERFQSRTFDLPDGAAVVVVDDWITTGSTIRAARSLVEHSAARYVGASVLVNKADQAVLDDLGVAWLVAFDEIGRGAR